MSQGLDTCALADEGRLVPLLRLLFFDAKTDRSCPQWRTQEIEARPRTCPYGLAGPCLGACPVMPAWVFAGCPIVPVVQCPDMSGDLPCFQEHAPGYAHYRLLVPPAMRHALHPGCQDRLATWSRHLSGCARQISPYDQVDDTNPYPVMSVRSRSCCPGRARSCPFVLLNRAAFVVLTCP